LSIEGQNKARGRSATAIDRLYSWYPSYAVDGNYSTYACTGWNNNSWWAVDLASPKYVIGLNVTNYSAAGKQFTLMNTLFAIAAEKCIKTMIKNGNN
jgi:hypothetical protein